MTYFNLDELPALARSDLVAAVVGGSSAFGDKTPSSDVDCLIVLRSRQAVYRLAANLALIESFCLLTASQKHAEVITDALSRELPFDCLRIGGVGIDGNKKSVKVVSIESFSESTPQHFYVLSAKDKRAYVHPRSSAESRELRPGLSYETPQGTPYYLLRDHDVGTTPRFGITADLLTTGAILVGDTLMPVSNQVNTEIFTVATRLVQKLTRLHSSSLPADLSHLWQRWPRFCPSFRQALVTWADFCPSSLDPAVSASRYPDYVSPILGCAFQPSPKLSSLESGKLPVLTITSHHPVPERTRLTSGLYGIAIVDGQELF
jgi:hypothetical protein